MEQENNHKELSQSLLSKSNNNLSDNDDGFGKKIEQVENQNINEELSHNQGKL